jgi:hypothetical protein
MPVSRRTYAAEMIAMLMALGRSHAAGDDRPMTLEPVPRGAISHYATVNGVKLHFVTAGSGGPAPVLPCPRGGRRTRGHGRTYAVAK